MEMSPEQRRAFFLEAAPGLPLPVNFAAEELEDQFSDQWNQAMAQYLGTLEMGIGANLAVLPPLLKGPQLTAVAVAPSSKALAHALEAAGHVRPPGAAAHHIVAGSAPAAAPVRAILQQLGIGINDAANGVFLQATGMTPNLAGSAVHATLHTREYCQAVNQALSVVKTRAEAEAAPDAIRQALLSGGL